jgi:hypothetical protein
LLQRAQHAREKVQAVKDRAQAAKGRAQAVKEKVVERLQTPGPVRQWYRESDHPLWQWAKYHSDRPALCACLPQWDPCLAPPLYTYFLTPDCANACRPPKVLKCRERDGECAARIKLMLSNLNSLTDLRNLRAKPATPVLAETPEGN